MIIESLVCAAIARELIFHKIVDVAARHNVSESAMTYVVMHEAAKMKDKDGNIFLLPCGDGDGHLKDPDGEAHRSRGIVQINEYWHPEVSDEEAYDVDFALNFLAEGLKEGRGHEWTTWREYTKRYQQIAAR
jgi:hypothetical protein